MITDNGSEHTGPFWEAPEIAKAGFPVFPISPKDKHPSVKGGFYACTTDMSQIAAWIEEGRECHNVAIPTGIVSGVVVVEADTPERYAGMERSYGLPTVKTRKGGHWYFRHPRNGKVISNNVREGLDRKGDGGYVLVPPSLGRTWTSEAGIPDRATLPVLPEEFWSKGREKTQASPGERKVEDWRKVAAAAVIAARVDALPQGKRNAHLMPLCRVLLDRGSMADAEDILVAAWEAVPDLSDRAGREVPNTLRQTQRKLDDDEPTSGVPEMEKLTPGLFEQLKEIMSWSATDSSDGSDSFSDIYLKTPKFPVEAMPVKTRAFIREAAAAIDCSVDLVGVPTLGALSAAIGFSVEAQRSEDYTQSAALYLGCVDEPGSGKSPAQNAAVRPVKDQQRKLKEKYEELKEDYEDELRQYEAEKKKAAKEGEAAGRPPQKPTFSRTWVDDTTIEAMAAKLEENPRGLYLIQDELTGWVKSFDQYKSAGKGSTRQKYLQIWGNETISVDRVNRDEPTIVERPFVTIYGGIQPKHLPEIADGRDDGFIDRFLLAYPEPHVSYDNDNEVSTKARMEYHGLIEKLYQAGSAGEPVEFTRAARSAYRKHSHHLSDEQRFGEMLPGLKNAWSKMRAYLIRLSLIMACCRMAETDDEEEAQITEVDVENAALLVDYFKDMACKVHRQSEGSVTRTKVASEIISILRGEGGQMRATAAEFQGMLPSAPDTPKATSHMLERIAKGTLALEFERGYRGKERVIKLSLNTEKTAGTVGTVGGDEQTPASEGPTDDEGEI